MLVTVSPKDLVAGSWWWCVRMGWYFFEPPYPHPSQVSVERANSRSRRFALRRRETQVLHLNFLVMSFPQSTHGLDPVGVASKRRRLLAPKGEHARQYFREDRIFVTPLIFTRLGKVVRH